ncbi:hypothetical protein GCM10008983_19630 [Lentibacillus halophilus]|uniref:Lipopolysaccharide assembly protein A domain-containing protein n=1 Tax=Lentibacillus halophilus TaxID=295065 RepID=A0ABP3J5A2_9BACI
MKGQSYIILSILFVIIVSAFSVANVDLVEINYLFGTGEVPLIFVILFSVLMGGLITVSAGAVKLFQLQRKLKSLQAERDQMETTLSEHGLEDIAAAGTDDHRSTEE